MQRTVSGVFVALLLASGCAVGGEDRPASEKPRETPSRALDLAGTAACNEFARWLAAGEDPATRDEMARKVHVEASNSNSGEIDDKAEVLFRNSLKGNGETWALAADSFAFECQDLGWTADSAQ
ncbi:hypothetical protein SEA_GALACTICA_51 [Streptomyces phage Galactica]|nr:hypothetical protein SEA_GALACTICA_51 [Streptomyces phage Galactica]